MYEDAGEFVGIKNIYVADVTDSASAYVAGSPAAFAPAASLIYDQKPTKKSKWYNNKIRRNYYGEGDSELKIIIGGLSTKTRAALAGKNYDESTGRMYDGGDPNPPYKALGFELDMGLEDAMFVWFLKGTFSLGNEEAATKTGDVDEKTTEITFSPLVTDYQWTVDGEAKGLKRVVADTTDAAFSETGWFSQVQTPSTVGAPDALALSSSTPADGASSVSKTANISATFNNAMNQSNTKFTLLDTVTGNVITLTVTWDAAGKVATMAHAALSGTVKHILVYNSVDIYGQELNGALDFTTAA